MSLSVKFNDIELNEILDVEIGFNPFEGADWERSLNSIPVTTGSTLVNSKVGVKTISMPFTMKGDINTKYDNLQRILNVAEPKKLSFGHMPNRYFLAVTTGKTDFKEVRKGFIGHGTITWLIPDGISHSVDTKIVTASVVDGILTANVNNNGSDDIWPVYRFKYPKENGYQGIVHAGGALELGNKEEKDGVDYFASETLLDTTTFDENNWSNWTGTYKPDPNYDNFDMSGTLKKGGYGLELDTFGNNTKRYNGAAKVYTLQADSNGVVGAESIYVYLRSLFWAGAMGQTALQDIVLWAGNVAIARWHIFKWDKLANSATARAFVGDGQGNLKQLTNYKLDFTANHLDNENPFNVTNGSMDILKNGELFRFNCKGSSIEVKVPALKDTKVTRVSVGFVNYDKATGDKYVSINVLRRLLIQKVKMPAWRDVPNRYADNSELVVDTESGNVYLNGLSANDELISGSQFKPLKPGDNKIEFYQSNWITSTPSVSVEYKERYL